MNTSFCFAQPGLLCDSSSERISANLEDVTADATRSARAKFRLLRHNMAINEVASLRAEPRTAITARQLASERACEASEELLFLSPLSFSYSVSVLQKDLD